MLGFPVLHYLPELAQTLESVMPIISSSVVPFSSCLQFFPASGSIPTIQLFALDEWPQYWRFIFSIRPSNEYSGLISFRIDRFDLLAVQGTLKSLLQHHSLKISILQGSVFLKVQLSHLYIAARKTEERKKMRE